MNNERMTVDNGGSEEYAEIKNERPSLKRLWWSLAVGGAAAVGSFILLLTQNETVGDTMLGTIGFSVLIFTFVSMLFYDCAVREVIAFMASRSIAFPGLIWEFSIDGFLWLIGMKILFWVVGLLFGIICALLGVIIGIIISPFIYPFVIVRYIRDPSEYD